MVSGWGGSEGEFLNVPISISTGGEGPIDSFELSVNGFTDDGLVFESEGKGGDKEECEEDKFGHVDRLIINVNEIFWVDNIIKYYCSKYDV